MCVVGAAVDVECVVVLVVDGDLLVFDGMAVIGGCVVVIGCEVDVECVVVV